MHAIFRYGLILAAGAVVVLCFAGARLPVSAISGRSVAVPSPLVPANTSETHTLESAIKRKAIGRHSIERLGGRGFQFIRAQHPWPPGTGALQAVQQVLPASARQEAQATYQISEIVSACLSVVRPIAEPPYERLPRELADKLRERDAQTLLDCESLLLTTEIVEKDWLALAAAQGSPQAGVLYAASARQIVGDEAAALASPAKVEAWRTRAAAYLWRAARLGSAEALITLADGHLEGIPMERDAIKAYAFYRAWARLSPKFGAPEFEHHYGGRLTAAQKKEALSRSREIYRGCCEPLEARP